MNIMAKAVIYSERKMFHNSFKGWRKKKLSETALHQVNLHI